MPPRIEHETAEQGARVLTWPRQAPRPRLNNDDFRALEAAEARTRRTVAGLARIVAKALEDGDVAKVDRDAAVLRQRHEDWRLLRHNIDEERRLRAAHLDSGDDGDAA
jgi:hypothetical protein